jgi:vacuolar-type H+-ATPase catalytic subunit A/Vma1
LIAAVYGTVDQSAVKALRKMMPDPAKHHQISQMNPGNLTLSDSVILIGIMREKARELNARFSPRF